MVGSGWVDFILFILFHQWYIQHFILFYQGTLSIIFKNTRHMFKANLFFLANTQNPDQV